MVSNLSYFAGMAATQVGGTACVAMLAKHSDRVFKWVPTDAKIAVGSIALMATLDTVTYFMEESTPFWRGVTKSLPMVALITAKVISEVYAKDQIGLKEPEVITSEAFKKSKKSWENTLQVALSCGLVSLLSSSKLAYPAVAGVLGSLLGTCHVKQAADEARKILKKDS